jgi:hypothetical protein
MQESIKLSQSMIEFNYCFIRNAQRLCAEIAAEEETKRKAAAKKRAKRKKKRAAKKCNDDEDKGQ